MPEMKSGNASGLDVRPKIAMLHYTCPPVVGGVEAVMAAHAALFAANGYAVTMIAGRGPAPDPATLPPNVSVLIEPLIDSKSERLNAINRQLEAGTIPPDFAAFENEIYQRLQTLLAPFPVCIVHNAHTLHKNLALTSALARISADFVGQPSELGENNLTVVGSSTEVGTKIIAWCHDLAWSNELYLPVLHSGYPWDLLRTAIPNVTYVTVSEPRRAEFANVFLPPVPPVEVVPNGVDLNQFLKIGAETAEIVRVTGLVNAVLEGAMLLLLPARITRRKNIELAVRVVAALKMQGRKVRLIVTGPPGPHNVRSDEYARELFALRESLKVEHEVIFLMESWQDEAGRPRPISDEVVSDLYRYCDALLFTSAQEGFGIPVLEAGLAKLPVFCTNIPPLLEIAGENAHYFNPTAAPEAVASLITSKLENDPVYRLRHSVLANYVWDSIFETKIKKLLGVS